MSPLPPIVLNEVRESAQERSGSKAAVLKSPPLHPSAQSWSGSGCQSCCFTVFWFPNAAIYLFVIVIICCCHSWQEAALMGKMNESSCRKYPPPPTTNNNNNKQTHRCSDSHTHTQAFTGKLPLLSFALVPADYIWLILIKQPISQ